MYIGYKRQIINLPFEPIAPTPRIAMDNDERSLSSFSNHKFVSLTVIMTVFVSYGLVPELSLC